MTYWLKMLGSSRGGMDESVVPLVLSELRFPKKPSVRVGDKVVLYTLGHDKVFAIVEVFRPVERGEGPNPWDRWRCEVRKVLVTSYDRAPGLDALTSGRDLRTSIRQQSHIRLQDEEYERAVEALRAAGAEPDRLYTP